MTENDIREMEDLLERESTCVLATSSPEGRPHCSLMAYTYDRARRRLVMLTLRSTRKYANMSANPHVSVLVDTRVSDGPDAGPARALTVTGSYAGVLSGEERDLAKQEFLRRHEKVGEMLRTGNPVFFAVDATAMLLMNGPLDACYVELPPQACAEE